MWPRRASRPTTPFADGLQVVAEHRGLVVHREAGCRRDLAAGDAHRLALTAGLRRAVAVDDEDTGQAVHQCLLHRGRQDRAARQQHAQRRQVERRGFRRVEDLDERTGERVAHEDDEVRLLGADQLPERERVEVTLRRDDDAAAAEQRAEGHPVRGAVHERARGDAPSARHDAAFRDLLGSRDRCRAAARAAHRTEEHVFVAPHDAFRHPGGPARVEDVERVGRPFGEVAVAERHGERGLVLDRADRSFGVRVRAVVDDDERAEAGQGVTQRGELRRELAVEDHGACVGVVEEVPQLLLDVAIVHVDRDRTELERGEHPFEVLDAVVQVQRDVVARADAAAGEHVGELRGALVGLREREPSGPAHERGRGRAPCPRHAPRGRRG